MTDRFSYSIVWEKTKTIEERKKLVEYSRQLENRIRVLFVTKRESKLLEDPYLTLINLYESYHIFKPVTEKPNDGSCLMSSQIPALPVVDMIQFSKQFQMFTEFVFEGFDWNNVLIAGGSVLASLIPIGFSDYTQWRQYYHKGAWDQADIDLFLYGLEPDQANEKLRHIYNHLSQHLPNPVTCLRTANTVNFVSKYPFRNIQVILRLYKSPAEILLGFDVDCATVGFDGQNVWTTGRGHYSLVHRRNVVDLERRSHSYEYRLWKYGLRGFEIAVSGLEQDKVNSYLYQQRIDKTQGLARLLILSKLTNEEDMNKYNNNYRTWKLRPPSPHLLNDLERVSKSDYSDVFIPCGSTWDAQKIVDIASRKDPNRECAYQPCQWGTIDEVLIEKYPVPEWTKLSEESSKQIKDNGVYGPLKWTTINIGQQKIGSFHPLSTEDWFDGVYIDDDYWKLRSAVVSGDTETIKTILDEKSELVNVKDCTDRTIFHLASICNDCKVLALIANYNPTWGFRMNDGRTAFHLICQHGSLDTVQWFYAKINEDGADDDKDRVEKDVSLKLDSRCWDFGLRPIHYAFINERFDICDWLIEKGLVLDNIGFNNFCSDMSPLHVALVMRSKTMIQYVLAKCRVPTDDLHKTFHDILKSANMDLIQLFLDIGIDLNQSFGNYIYPINIILDNYLNGKWTIPVVVRFLDMGIKPVITFAMFKKNMKKAIDEKELQYDFRYVMQPINQLCHSPEILKIVCRYADTIFLQNNMSPFLDALYNELAWMKLQPEPYSEIELLMAKKLGISVTINDELQKINHLQECIDEITKLGGKRNIESCNNELLRSLEKLSESKTTIESCQDALFRSLLEKPKEYETWMKYLTNTLSTYPDIQITGKHYTLPLLLIELGHIETLKKILINLLQTRQKSSDDPECLSRFLQTLPLW